MIDKSVHLHKDDNNGTDSSMCTDIIVSCNKRFADELKSAGITPKKQLELLNSIYALLSNSFDHYFISQELDNHLEENSDEQHSPS